MTEAEFAETIGDNDAVYGIVENVIDTVEETKDSQNRVLFNGELIDKESFDKECDNFYEQLSDVGWELRKHVAQALETIKHNHHEVYDSVYTASGKVVLGIA